MMQSIDLEYVGFWPRVGASLIDILLQVVITAPLTYMVYGQYTSGGWVPMGTADILINFILPAIAVIALWVRWGATPGKMAMSARVVDRDTGAPLSIGMSLLRYVGYFISALPFFVGFIWIAFDRRKQGWHDKIANSVVVRPKGTESVRFSGEMDWQAGSARKEAPKEPTF